MQIVPFKEKLCDSILCLPQAVAGTVYQGQTLWLFRNWHDANWIVQTNHVCYFAEVNASIWLQLGETLGRATPRAPGIPRGCVGRNCVRLSYS